MQISAKALIYKHFHPSAKADGNERTANLH